MANIRYGSEVVLRHEPTQFFLCAPGGQYTHPHSSHQGQITCRNNIDSKCIWIIKAPHLYPDDYLFGQPVPNNAIIRLENRSTAKTLHSHGNTPSPLSNQGEVTCYGEAGLGDFNDNWRIEISELKTPLSTDFEFRLIHTLTNYALHSHA